MELPPRTLRAKRCSKSQITCSKYTAEDCFNYRWLLKLQFRRGQEQMIHYMP